MKKAIIVAAMGLALASTGTALAWDADEEYEKQYVQQYEATEEACGEGSPGRNIVLDGLGEDYDVEAGRERVASDTAQMAAAEDACLNPVAVETSTNAAPAEAAPAVSAGGCPAEMAGEATSPTAVNSESGAYGCWQQLPSHREPGGLCEGMGTDMAGQVACTEALCANGGDAHWSASGATPCS